jgi:hypothetical protein
MENDNTKIASDWLCTLKKWAAVMAQREVSLGEMGWRDWEEHGREAIAVDGERMFNSQWR